MLFISWRGWHWKSVPFRGFLLFAAATDRLETKANIYQDFRLFLRSLRPSRDRTCAEFIYRPVCGWQKTEKYFLFHLNFFGNCREKHFLSHFKMWAIAHWLERNLIYFPLRLFLAPYGYLQTTCICIPTHWFTCSIFYDLWFIYFHSLLMFDAQQTSDVFNCGIYKNK